MRNYKLVVTASVPVINQAGLLVHLEATADLVLDWVPSWLPSLDSIQADPFFWEDFEDGLAYQAWNVVDAIREVDGLPVMLKILVSVDVKSVPFATYFSQEPRKSDRRNHCAPLLEVLRFPEFPKQPILVHPRFIPWDIWPFVRVSEIVNFLSQIFEGLAFMHEHCAVHLDACFKNIMMDGLHLLKEPCHPVQPLLKACGQGAAQHRERYESAEPVKYYFIDFDMSLRFPDISAIRPVERRGGQEDSAPELSSPPYDAFRLDVFCIGKMILVHILNAYENVEFVRPIVIDMINPDPAKRPTAQEVTSRFENIRRLLFRTELDQSPGFIADYDWRWYFMGEISDRDPPPRRRWTVAGTRLPPSPFDLNTSLESYHPPSHSRSYSQL